MAIGVKGFDPKAKVTGFNNTPVPDGVYELKLIGKSVEISRSEKKAPNEAVPYVKWRAEILGTATEEFPRNKMYFGGFYLSNVPGQDGVCMWEREGGLIDFARASDGDCPDFGSVKMNEEISHVDAPAVAEWLKEKDGRVFRARLVVKAKTAEYAAKNELKNWVPDEEAPADSAPPPSSAKKGVAPVTKKK